MVSLRLHQIGRKAKGKVVLPEMFAFVQKKEVEVKK